MQRADYGGANCSFGADYWGAGPAFAVLASPRYINEYAESVCPPLFSPSDLRLIPVSHLQGLPPRGRLSQVLARLIVSPSHGGGVQLLFALDEHRGERSKAALRLA